ncbi:hypothetical protein CJO94_12135 [Ralstonia solanacearum]|nr:hypothetical protein CJO94_12135 [Ralstonia solanacearum]
MTGTVVTFSLDLLSIPFFFQAKGDDDDVLLSLRVNGLPVRVTLSSENSPALTDGGSGLKRFFYNKISIKISSPDEDLQSHDFVEGRARFLLMEFQAVVIEVINRLVRYFKYNLRHPNLREITYVDLLNQEQQFCNPVWQVTDGTIIAVSDKPISSGVLSILGVGLLHGDLFGIVPFTTEKAQHLEQCVISTDHSASLSDQLLSDAQGAALAGNIRRAVLELAVSIEVFVKTAFFKQEKIAGSVFDYLEDKGRETVKVIELLDGVAFHAFGESYKNASPQFFRHLDHIFRCRNKIAHRGEARYRDDTGAWHQPDQELLRQWWKAAIDMFVWLQSKVTAAKSQTNPTR